MKKYSLVMMVLSLVMVLPAHANYICNGNVTNLYVANDGTITVTMTITNSGQSGVMAGANLCKLGAASSGNGWTVDSCKAAYTTLLAAKISGQKASIYFSDSLSCSAQPSWGAFVAAYNVAAEDVQ